jgi:uncharacterized membrane protein YidH (DUF202 family)
LRVPALSHIGGKVLEIRASAYSVLGLVLVVVGVVTLLVCVWDYMQFTNAEAMGAASVPANASPTAVLVGVVTSIGGLILSALARVIANQDKMRDKPTPKS